MLNNHGSIILYHLWTTFTQIPWFPPSVPVSVPVIEKSPSYAVIEDKANVTWTCSVQRGSRVVFQWLRDNVALGPSDRYHFSKDNSTLFISPVRKEDQGSYRCVASNPISEGRYSRAKELTVYCEYRRPSHFSEPGNTLSGTYWFQTCLHIKLTLAEYSHKNMKGQLFRTVCGSVPPPRPLLACTHVAHMEVKRACALSCMHFSPKLLHQYQRRH